MFHMGFSSHDATILQGNMEIDFDKERVPQKCQGSSI